MPQSIGKALFLTTKMERKNLSSTSKTVSKMYTYQVFDILFSCPTIGNLEAMSIVCLSEFGSFVAFYKSDKMFHKGS